MLRKKCILFFTSLGISAICFFFVYDYGITTDELIQRKRGLIAADYINDFFGGNLFEEKLSDKDLENYKLQPYGTSFQLVNVALELVLYENPTLFQKLYLRHQVLLILFGLALFSWGLLLLQRFDKLWLSLIGVLLLASTPRVLGHQFFNVKDSVLLCTYIMACSSGFWFLSSLEKKSTSWLTHGFMTGLTTSARVLGIFILPLTIGVVLLRALLTGTWKVLWKLAPYAVSSCIFIIILWPYLWDAPLQQFILGFQDMSQFAWNGPVFLDGNLYNGHNLPWFYVPRWILISSPILSLVFILFGLVSWVVYPLRHLKRQVQKDSFYQDLFMFLAFLGPLMAVIVFNSVMYNAWRQMLFIYPPLLYFAILGLNRLLLQGEKSALGLKSTYVKTIGALLILLQLNQVVRMHPFENCYFNALAKKPWVAYYDVDYWCHGYLYTMKYLSEHPDIVPDEEYKVAATNPGLASLNYRFSRDTVKNSFDFQYTHKKPHVLLSHFRRPDEKKGFIEKKGLYQYPLGAVKRKGQIIYGIYDNTDLQQ